MILDGFIPQGEQRYGVSRIFNLVQKMFGKYPIDGVISFQFVGGRHEIDGISLWVGWCFDPQIE